MSAASVRFALLALLLAFLPAHVLAVPGQWMSRGEGDYPTPEVGDEEHPVTVLPQRRGGGNRLFPTDFVWVLLGRRKADGRAVAALQSGRARPSRRTPLVPSRDRRWEELQVARKEWAVDNEVAGAWEEKRMVLVSDEAALSEDVAREKKDLEIEFPGVPLTQAYARVSDLDAVTVRGGKVVVQPPGGSGRRETVIEPASPGKDS